MDYLGYKHHLQPIPEFPHSFALLSDDARTDTAAIFVHGFDGDAHDTWFDFPSLIDYCSPKYPWWQTCDAYFYQYGSVRRPIAVSAHNILPFIQSIFPDPRPDLFNVTINALDYDQSLGVRDGKMHYDKLLLVGHSEGAVILRRALIERFKVLGENPKLKLPDRHDAVSIAAFFKDFPLYASRLILFAPAYLGASCSGWAGVLLHLSKLGTSLNALLSYFPAYVDLQKASPVLERIREDTEDFAQNYPWMTAWKAQSYFGEAERLVFIGEYRTDPISVVVENQNHLSICKPNRNFDKPLEFVRYDYEQKRSASGS